MRASLVLPILVFLSVPALAGTSSVTVSPVARTHVTATGQAIVVPDHPDVVVSTATFPPGARLPVHKHPYPHFAYVLEGTLTVTNTQTGKTFEVKTGQFLAEMQDTWHFGMNNGREPVKLLIIDEVPHGVASNVVAKL
jgi:quercetin dioxygenase-like cupin family protein